MLSLHFGFWKHTPACGQVQPLSAWQRLSQPLPGFFGSHVSPSSITLLPHTAGCEIVGAAVQSTSQPFEPGGFASHASPGSTTKLPHLIELAQVVGLFPSHVKNGSTL